LYFPKGGIPSAKDQFPNGQVTGFLDKLRWALVVWLPRYLDAASRCTTSSPSTLHLHCLDCFSPRILSICFSLTDFDSFKVKLDLQSSLSTLSSIKLARLIYRIRNGHGHHSRPRRSGSPLPPPRLPNRGTLPSPHSSRPSHLQNLSWSTAERVFRVTETVQTR
jgi:hypothetical protein